MNTSTIYAIDLAKSVFHIVGLSSGKIIFNKRMRRKPVLEYFAQCPASIVAMEACPGAHWMARRLESMGHTPKILPAQYVKPFAQKQKNDANDALAIAEASLRPSVRPIVIKRIDQQDLQALHRIRQRLVNQRSRLVCQARGILLEYGIVLRGGVGNFKSQLPDVLEDAENELTPLMRNLLENTRDELIELNNRIKQISDQIKAWADRDDTARRLQSIPGIGPLGASALVAAVGDAKQFRRARDLSAWLGLVPKQNSTGGKPKLGNISKQGNTYIRTLLIHGARACMIHLNREHDCLGLWIDQLLSRMHKNKVIVALANKIARIAWVVLTKSSQVYKRNDPIYS